MKQFGIIVGFLSLLLLSNQCNSKKSKKNNNSNCAQNTTTQTTTGTFNSNLGGTYLVGVDYDTTVKQLMDSYCVSCHSSSPQAGKTATQPYLTSYQEVSAKADRVQARLQQGDMPPSSETNRPPSTAAQTIQTWITDGKPQSGSGSGTGSNTSTSTNFATGTQTGTSANATTATDTNCR